MTQDLHHNDNKDKYQVRDNSTAVALHVDVLPMAATQAVPRPLNKKQSSGGQLEGDPVVPAEGNRATTASRATMITMERHQQADGKHAVAVATASESHPGASSALPRPACGSHWQHEKGQQQSHEQNLSHLPCGGSSSCALENATAANQTTQDHDGGDGTLRLPHHCLEQIQSHSGWQLTIPSSGTLNPLPAVAPGGRSVSTGGSAPTAAVAETAGGRRALDGVLRDALRQTHKRPAGAPSASQSLTSSGIATEQWLSQTTTALHKQQQYHDHQHRPTADQDQLRESQRHIQNYPQAEKQQEQQQQQHQQ